jgi:hypothetical protein
MALMVRKMVMLRLAVMILWTAGFTSFAHAEARIALIVGNGNYSNVGSLDNPIADAELMATTLETKGFTVTLLKDATQTNFNRSIAQFGRDLRTAGKDATGLFYYAGHGVQSFGSNYLLPVDASLTNAADLGLVAVQADAVLRQMFSAKNKTNIVILDACRNNPFDAIPELNDNGLAEMKSPTGTFLSYSTAPGAVALDGLDGNSPFTKTLAKQIPTPGLAIEQVFKKVRVEVLKQTNGLQTPWDTSSLTGDFFFVAAAKASPEEVVEKQLWDSVRITRDPVQIMLFLRGYPKSQFGSEARALLKEVMSAEIDIMPESPESKVEVAPVKIAPEAREKELIGVARKSEKAADYEAYLAEFPDGVYTELAKFELNIIAKKAEVKQETEEKPEIEEGTSEDKVATSSETSSEVTFATPLNIGDEKTRNMSFEQLILNTPLFPPIEGIPEDLWKNKTCSNCHAWTREALCTQGDTYLAENSARALSKQHPFGGSFKHKLKLWAENGCK